MESNAIRLTNRTAIALRRQAKRTRNAYFVMGAVGTLLLLALAVYLGMMWLPAVPLLLAGVGLCGVLTGTDVFSALTDGARDGLKTVMCIFPALVALLTAVSMLRASGALEALTRLCAPVLAWLGIPPETAMLLLVRPISGSGALAAASDIIQTYGADSRIGRTAAVMLGSTETTFYVLAVYFGACGIRRSRWAIPAAIVADVTGFVTAAALVRCLWGT